MYSLLWRILPGPLPLKVAQALVLAVGAVAFCFVWLFPRIAPHMPFNDNTIDTPASSPATPSPSR